MFSFTNDFRTETAGKHQVVDWGHRPSAMWRRLIVGYLVSDFLRQRRRLIFKGRNIHEEFFMGTYTLEDELKYTKSWSVSEHLQQLDIVGSVYHLVIYMQSNKIHNVVLMSKFYSALFVSSTCFRPHRSITGSVLYKLYSQILYVVISVLLDTSSRYNFVTAGRVE